MIGMMFCRAELGCDFCTKASEAQLASAEKNPAPKPKRLLLVIDAMQCILHGVQTV